MESLVGLGGKSEPGTPTALKAPSKPNLTINRNAWESEDILPQTAGNCFNLYEAITANRVVAELRMKENHGRKMHCGRGFLAFLKK